MKKSLPRVSLKDLAQEHFAAVIAAMERLDIFQSWESHLSQFSNTNRYWLMVFRTNTPDFLLKVYVIDRSSFHEEKLFDKPYEIHHPGSHGVIRYYDEQDAFVGFPEAGLPEVALGDNTTLRFDKDSPFMSENLQAWLAKIGSISHFKLGEDYSLSYDNNGACVLQFWNDYQNPIVLATHGANAFPEPLIDMCEIRGKHILVVTIFISEIQNIWITKIYRGHSCEQLGFTRPWIRWRPKKTHYLDYASTVKLSQVIENDRVELSVLGDHVSLSYSFKL